ncbi:MAG: haloacid dehalogenase-like hydrolase [Planctomycetota bacterium]|nr:MAG: haloacid dehalogenase-like hydrolase [Planctomycetota bacterium]
MPGPLFTQNTIAIIWDFDKTLIPGYMQEPLFRRFGVDGAEFWREVNRLPQAYRERGAELVARDTIYLNHILAYVRAGRFRGLNNRMLRELGAELEFYPGVPEVFERLQRQVTEKPEYIKREIEVEHYVISTGLRQMILGSSIAPWLEGVWACEFVEGTPGPGYLAEERQGSFLSKAGPEITEVAYAIDNTTKTRAVFEINKGSNKNPEIHVNAAIAEELRRVPFENMIYVADGPSDVPVFSVVNRNGGKTFAVYKAGSEAEFMQVNELQRQGRIHAFGEADYRPESHTSMWLRTAVRQIADRIVERHRRAVADRTGRAPTHIED